MSGKIVVVGSLNMDLVVGTPRHPEIGETILGNSFQTFPGGKGANQAVAAARLGGKVYMVGRVGADGFGETLIQTLNQDGVDTTFVRKDTQYPTGVALITVDVAGQNTIVVVSGANWQVTPDDVDNATAAFEGAAILLLQLESPLPAIRRAIELARKYNLKVVLNPAPASDLEAAFLCSVDYLIPNQSELALLAGVEGIENAVSCLRDLGVPTLVVTLGEEGSLVVGKRKKVYLPSYRVTPVDTTAAGDAFVGAFAVALTEGLDARKAAQWGNAAGALAVTKAGAQPSLPRRAELDQFLMVKK